MEVVLERKLDIDKSNWSLVRFGDVVFEPKESTKNPKSDGLEKVIGLEHIESEDIHLRNYTPYNGETSFTKVFREGDVLFGRRRAYLKKAAQASFDGICSGDITVFRAKDNLLSSLLPFIVNNDKFFDYAVKHSAGGLSPRVKFKDLANYEFLLPPKEQQAQLAELLWSMDEVIEREREILKKLDMSLQSFNNSVFKKTNKKLGEVIFNTISGGTPNTKNTLYYNNGTIPWITTKIIDNDKVSYGEKLISEVSIKESAAKILPAGNIVAGTRVGVGKFAVNDIDISFSQDVTGLVLNTDKIDPFFLVYQLNSKLIQEKLKPILRGTTIKGITKSDLLNLNILVPSLEDQIEIKGKLKTIKESFKILTSKTLSSKSLQKSLINQIF